MSHILHNGNGMTADILPLGGIIQRLTAPDREGRYSDVLLGFDLEEAYEQDHPCFGALIGRYANRIANGKFTIGGTEYELARNHGAHHLHGGFSGFDKIRWAVEKAGPSIVLRHVSDDGDQGYPGELSVSVRYTLTDDDALQIEYAATTTRSTPINLTSHPYFNLAGSRGAKVLDHHVTIRANRYTPVDKDLIPTGEMASVSDTPFDFRHPLSIGERIAADNEQLAFGGGYDHNFVLESSDGQLRLAATVVEPVTGRVLEVLTTEPGLQFYTANALDNVRGKNGAVYGRYSGFCMETQHFPDSPNHPDFPATILHPGERYESTTVYRFSTMTSNP